MSLELVAQYSQFIGAAVFIVVIILLFNKYVGPAVASNEKAKNAEIADAELRREKLKAEVAAARAEVENASRDAAAIEARAKTDAAHDRERMIAEAHADAARIIHNAEGELDRARIAANATLREEFVTKALAEARRIATGRVDAQTNAKLVGATIDRVAAEHAKANG
jgi:F-type H+-transporting ATPase subunit b